MRNTSSGSVRVFYPKLSREQVVALLRERVPALRKLLPVVRVVLFGSYARGTYTVASDVDVLVVYQGPPREDAYAIVKKGLNIPGLEPHVYTEDEYRAVADTLDRMTADGIVIFPPNAGEGTPRRG